MNDADAAIAAEEQEVKNPFPTPPVYWTRYTPENLRLLARLREKIVARRQENGASQVEETGEENRDDEDVDQAVLLPGEELLPSFPLLELEPPRLDWILEEESYSSFGEVHPTKEIVQVLPPGIQKLYDPEPKADPRPHLRQLLVSLLSAYHKLLSDVLEPVPSGYHGPPPEEIQAKLNAQAVDGQEGSGGEEVAWPPPLNWEATILWMRTITLNLGWAVNEFRPVQARMNLESIMQRQIDVRREETRAIHSKCDELERMLADLRKSSAVSLVLPSNLITPEIHELKEKQQDTDFPSLTMDDLMKWSAEVPLNQNK
ncbi:Mediator of RNA polymerase II transcription subunit 7 [Serendipita sp. 396]|nr:Mediator of RNA polymerase II transcription subunit 7 [Serendipita sp. 396]